MYAHHVLPPLHKLLVDDLTCVVLPGLDMDRLFHDRIRPAAQGLPSSVLEAHNYEWVVAA